MTGTRQYHQPSQGEFVSGCKMPSAATIEAGDRNARLAAEEGSRALLEAIRRYFLKGGRG